MVNLKRVADAMFRNGVDWSDITDSEKEESFFIFNRYFSKKYLTHSQFLNQKNIDKVAGMNIWYAFFLGKGYPKWFWQKAKGSANSNKNKKDSISNGDLLRLSKSMNLKVSDIEFLYEKDPLFIKEELKYLSSLDKQKKL